MRIRTIALLIPLALLAAACGGSAAKRAGVISTDRQGGVYVALGDSVAAGDGASDPATTSYVALIAAALRGELGPELELRTLASGGDTTQDLIDAQLDSAAEALRNDDVRLVTLTIGGNDLNVLAQDPGKAVSCIQDLEKPPCPIPEILTGIEQRLDTILGRLRDAGPNTPLAIELYPNLFSGTGNPFEQPAEGAFELVNEVIARVAGRYDVLLADPRADFTGRGGELTHLLDATPDPHPTDAGHRVIAEAFLKALGLEQQAKSTAP